MAIINFSQIASSIEEFKDNVDDLLNLAEAFHAESRFRTIRFCRAKMTNLIQRAIHNPTREAFLMCWDQSRAIGGLYCSAGEYHLGAGTILTTCHSIFVHPDIRHSLLSGRVSLGLMKGVETWSKARAAQEILFHATADIETARTHQFAKRLGYRFIGGSYAKAL